MKTTRPQIHLFWLLPGFLLLVGLTSGVLHPFRLLAASFFSSDERATTNVTQRASLPSDFQSLEVDNRFGAVRITASESGPFDWVWELTVKARSAEQARKGAEAVTFTAKTNAGRVQLIVSLPNSSSSSRTSFQSDLEIRAPQSVAVQTRNGFGETRISGVQGEVEATSQHGSMEIRDAGAKVRAQTSFATLTLDNSGPATLKNSHGSIAASNVRGSLDAETGFGTLKVADIGGPVILRNQHGSVEVSRAKGKANVKTSFATLRIEDVEADATLNNEHGSIEARAIAGSVKADTSFGSLKIAGAGASFDCGNRHGSTQIQATSTALTNLEARTSFGALEVRLPEDFAPAIHARTSFAEVESDFPVLQPPRGQDPFAGDAAGKPRISLQNEHGRIRVVRERPGTGR